MNYSLADALAIAGATALTFVVLVLPGAAVAAGVRIFNFHECAIRQRVGLALLTGLAVLPAFFSTIARFVSMDAALVAALFLGLAGSFLLARGARLLRPNFADFVIPLLWLAIVTVELVDFDVGGALYQSYTVIDMVKHAATVRAIADTGAPPIDPFFARSEPSSYYYFFYTIGALVQKLGFGLIDGRAATAGSIFWAGLALYRLALLLLEKCCFVETSRRRIRALVVALLLASGLDIIAMLWSGFGKGIWPPQLDMWNSAVAGWLDSLLWVPHHVAALLAAWIGFLILLGEMARVEDGAKARPIVLLTAALAFVSSLGMSVWLTLVAFLTAALWLALLTWERRWSAALVLGAVGLLSLALAVPHLFDMANRADEGFPIAITVRRFDILDGFILDPLVHFVARLVLLPINYALELGVFLLGTILFWARGGISGTPRQESARLLALSALSGFLFASFTASTILLNDLAWRAPLAFQLAALVWTAVASDRILTDIRTARRSVLGAGGLAGLVVLGWASTLYGLVATRAYVGLPVVKAATHVNAHPTTDHALRGAYRWMNRNLPPNAITQHNPTAPRVFDFGLYGRHNVGVADRQAILYGASRAEVAARVDALAPIFDVLLPASRVRDIARAQGISHLVVTPEDAPWRESGSWVWTTRPAYARDRVRIIPVAHLQHDPAIGRAAGVGS